MLSRKTISYMELPKNCILMNEFLKIQFKYCPIIWMFYSRPSSNKINGLFKRCQRKIYNNERSNFGQRLNKNFCF